MATRDSGSVSLRLSVTGAETVRNALTLLGRDGQRVLAQLEKASLTPSRGVVALNTAFSAGRSQLQSWSGNLGAVGAVAASLGPVGLAAAAGIGAIAVAFHTVARGAMEMAETAGKLRDLSDTTGFSIAQLQALVRAGAQVGVSQESITSGLERFTVQLDSAREASGELYNGLLKIDPALAEQFRQTKDVAEAWDLLAKAMARASTEQRNALARTVFGRGGIELTRLAGATDKAGGLSGLVADMKQVDLITRAQAEHWDDLGDTINENLKIAKQNFASVFTGPALEVMKAMTDGLVELSRLAKSIPWDSAAAVIRSLRGEPAPAATSITVHPLANPEDQGAEKTKQAIIAEANATAIWMAVLGDAATASEQLRNQQLQLAKAYAEGKINTEQYDRAVANLNLKHRESMLQARERLGVLTQEQYIERALIEVREAEARGFLKTEADKRVAREQAIKQAREQFEQDQVRRSFTPELTRFSLDSANTLKAVDQAGAGWFRGISDSLIDAVQNVKKFKDAGTEMANSIIRDLARIAMQKNLTGPLASSFSDLLASVFGGPNLASAGVGETGPALGSFVLKSALGNVFERGNVTRFDRGGIVDRLTHFRLANGGLASMAEDDKPEGILPLRRVDGRLGVDASGVRQPVNVTSTVHNYAGAPGVEQRVSRDRNGGLSIETIIPAIEDRLADRMARKQGALSKVPSRPPRG